MRLDTPPAAATRRDTTATRRDNRRLLGVTAPLLGVTPPLLGVTRGAAVGQGMSRRRRIPV
uniref:Uncharacterized protein n=1 Tax=mine drainage metagenome TaxID=410659 RepID=E6Q6Z0_9ZZZZ